MEEGRARMGVTTNTVPLIGVGNQGASPLAAPMSTTMFNTGARSSVEGYDPAVHDKFFEAVNTELGERGFITTSPNSGCHSFWTKLWLIS